MKPPGPGQRWWVDRQLCPQQMLGKLVTSTWGNMATPQPLGLGQIKVEYEKNCGMCYLFITRLSPAQKWSLSYVKTSPSFREMICNIAEQNIQIQTHRFTGSGRTCSEVSRVLDVPLCVITIATRVLYKRLECPGWSTWERLCLSNIPQLYQLGREVQHRREVHVVGLWDFAVHCGRGRSSYRTC